MKPKIILLWGSEWLCYTKDGATGYGKTPTSAYRGWCIASAHRRRGRRGAMPAPSESFRIAKEELAESRRWMRYAAKVVFGFVVVGVGVFIMLK